MTAFRMNPLIVLRSLVAAARIMAASSAEQRTSKAVRFCDFPYEPLRCMLRLAFFPLLGWLGLIARKRYQTRACLSVTYQTQSKPSRWYIGLATGAPTIQILASPGYAMTRCEGEMALVGFLRSLPLIASSIAESRSEALSPFRT